jgi:hypothetical protein
MLKTVTAVMMMTNLAISSAAAPITDWNQIKKTLDGIPTAAGVSLTKRLDSCKITMHKDASWMETLSAARPEYGAKPGQTILKIVFDLPPPPKQAGPSLPRPPQRNVPAIWIVDRGKATALSAWANALQNRPVPLGYDESNNC